MFEDIRPYQDHEISAAMARVVVNPYFPLLASYVFPGTPIEEVRKLVCSIDTIDDFQYKVMYKAHLRIIEDSISELTFSGIEMVRPDLKYLYVSNHRDIMLDASLLQSVLLNHGMGTTEITFGANLMQEQLIIDIGKSNKMFKVERPGGGLRAFYNSSKRLSDYIRMTLLDKKESIWIAQRNGRTKDGVDRTDQGIINMFRMSSSDDKMKAIAELRILPVSVSYEWEPCDMLKAMEIYISNHNSGTYVKTKGEDLNSILTGILQPKGRVHVAICEQITEDDLIPFSGLLSNEFNRKVAEILDRRICNEYKFWPNNYIAHDMLNESDEYESFYTQEEKNHFVKHISLLNEYSDSCDVVELRRILLGIYANPIDSKKYFNSL